MHNLIMNTVAVSFLAKFIADCLEYGKEWGLGCFRSIMLSAVVCFQFSRILVLLIFNFFSPLLFKLVYREFSNYYFITCIRNPARLMRWSFLQK